MEPRKCPQCGALFTPTYGSQVCCSEECQKKRRTALARASHEKQRRAKRRAAAKMDERAARKARLEARDRAYAALNVPVKVEYRNGVRIETRGQPRIASVGSPMATVNPLIF